MVRNKGFSHHDSKEALQHRGQVECAAGGDVRPVFGVKPPAGAIANGPGIGSSPRPSPSEHMHSEKVEEQRAR
jgi:hypothetical protein